MTRKKFKTVSELKNSKYYLPGYSFREIITIGGVRFFMNAYTIEDDDDSYVAFGCFHEYSNESPVFQRFTDAMRYAIETYNERIKNENI